ncbi:biotin--[acetyl-CoA-carboxylase] ligase [Mariniluteicoccus flavus]
MPATPPPHADALTDRLVRPGSLWSHVDVVASSGSTNADLATLARAGAAHGSVLVTDSQTAGRGRFTRAWTTPPGVSVAMSVLVRPDVPVRRWSWLPLMTGVAVVRGVRATSGVAATLKWPNDVLVGDRKLCGLLAERVDTPTEPAAVIGWGINVSMSTDELPVPTATSLLLEGAEVDKTALVGDVLEAFEAAYALWVDDPAALRAAYEAECGTLGREVRVMRNVEGVVGRGADDVEGTAVGVDDDGALLVCNATGTQSFSAGDVLHLRPR